VCVCVCACVCMSANELLQKGNCMCQYKSYSRGPLCVSVCVCTCVCECDCERA
jgi:hypothetical protein